MKYVQTHFLKENCCVLQVSLCALISRPVCARTRVQLRGNIDWEAPIGTKGLGDCGAIGSPLWSYH